MQISKLNTLSILLLAAVILTTGCKSDGAKVSLEEIEWNFSINDDAEPLAVKIPGQESVYETKESNLDLKLLIPEGHEGLEEKVTKIEWCFNMARDFNPEKEGLTVSHSYDAVGEYKIALRINGNIYLYKKVKVLESQPPVIEEVPPPPPPKPEKIKEKPAPPAPIGKRPPPPVEEEFIFYNTTGYSNAQRCASSDRSYTGDLVELKIKPTVKSELRSIRFIASMQGRVNVSIAAEKGGRFEVLNNRAVLAGSPTEISFENLGYVLKPGSIYTIVITPRTSGLEFEDFAYCNSTHKGNKHIEWLDSRGASIIYSLGYAHNEQ